MTEYYELVRRKLNNHGMIATAAVWFCKLCGDTIDGMGGPGTQEICIPCGDDIIAGKLRYDRAPEPTP